MKDSILGRLGRPGCSVVYLPLIVFILSAVGNGYPIPIPGVGMASDFAGSWLSRWWNWKGLCGPQKQSWCVSCIWRRDWSGLRSDLEQFWWLHLFCWCHDPRLQFRGLLMTIGNWTLTLGPLALKPFGQTWFVSSSIAFGLVSASMLTKECVRQIEDEIDARYCRLLILCCVSHDSARKCRRNTRYGRRPGLRLARRSFGTWCSRSGRSAVQS